MELDVLEGLTRSCKRRFGLCRPVRVVECDLRRAALGDAPKILDRQRGGEPALPRIQLGALEAQQWGESAGCGQSSNHDVVGVTG